MTVPTAPLVLERSYATLPPHLFAAASPMAVRAPELIIFNHALARDIGLDVAGLAPDTLGAIFSGNVVPEGISPLAMAYSGHQFGQFVPVLGDGRAMLLGEVRGRDRRVRDVQLKGAGPTPFSRRGDGRSALGPVLREYLVSEAMAALGIPATRALAAVKTGELVYRNRALPGGVMTRVALSHLRIGTFQYAAANGDRDGLKGLADFAIARLYPDLAEAENPYLALLTGVIARQASLVARWLLVGFIHGVMNTDNMSISGETIDFGPCAFLDHHDPAAVFSSIDAQGRYAYGNQPRIALWNLTRLAECLLPLIDEDSDKAVEKATAALEGFAEKFESAYFAGLRAKLGLFTEEEGDRQLAEDLMRLMAAQQADFTLTFRRLCDAAFSPASDGRFSELFADNESPRVWLELWRQRLERDGHTPQERLEAMRAVNPALIPRNHRIEEVIEAAIERDDFRPFHRLHAALAAPFEERPAFLLFEQPPAPNERVLQTFCGT